MRLRLTERTTEAANAASGLPKIKLSYTPADSFGSLRGAVSRTGGRGGVTDIEKESMYSPIKGIAGGVQKGLTGIAQIGGNTAAMLEDVHYAPLELISGKRIGEISDNGPLNLWNDSIDRTAERVEDYYAKNIAAGGTGAEFLDKLVDKTVSLIPQALYTMHTGGGSAVPELINSASHGLPGIAGDIQSAAERLAEDPLYWLSAAGTTGESYQEHMKEKPTEVAGGWLQNVARSLGKGLFKEAVGTSDEVPDVLSTLAEVAYEMYREKHDERPENSWLDALAQLMLK